MGTAIEAIGIVAGVDGGNFDQLIAYMGKPNAFIATSGNRNQIIFSETSGLTGVTVVIDITKVTVGYASNSLRLLASDGHVLLDLIWPGGGWVASSNSLGEWEGYFDAMMDSLQSAILNDQPGLNFTGGDGIDVLHGSLGSDCFYGGDGGDVFYGLGGNDSLNGGRGNESLIGGDGADTLIGGGHDDNLSGGNGLDLVDGGLGNDHLYGGKGADQMIGGGGADIFVFATASSAKNDIILDFDMGQGDLIDLRQFDADTGSVELDAFDFIGTAAFGDHAGELRFSHDQDGNTLVKGDINGDGNADFIITLVGTIAIDASAFVL